MNDWEELRYGMMIGSEAFRSSAVIREAARSAERYRVLVVCFEQLIREFDAEHAPDTYVLCFSECERDDSDGRLSMWRGYGAHGGGVALIVDLTDLGYVENSPLVVGQVHYASQVDRRKWIDDRLERLARVVRQYPMNDEVLMLAAKAWVERLKMFSLFTKHDGFSEEKEWRIVYMRDRDVGDALSEMFGYVITARGVEPKLKLRLSAIPGVADESASIDSLVSRVILGPSISSTLSVTAVRKMLSLAGRASLAGRVVASSIPFRPQ
jgi:hypothetical protein